MLGQIFHQTLEKTAAGERRRDNEVTRSLAFALVRGKLHQTQRMRSELQAILPIGKDRDQRIGGEYGDAMQRRQAVFFKRFGEREIPFGVVEVPFVGDLRRQYPPCRGQRAHACCPAKTFDSDRHSALG